MNKRAKNSLVYSGFVATAAGTCHPPIISVDLVMSFRKNNSTVYYFEPFLSMHLTSQHIVSGLQNIELS